MADTGKTDMAALALAMMELAASIQSEDGVPNIICNEAAARLGQLHQDLVMVAPALSAAAAKASRRTLNGRAFRAACDRLVGEALV